MDFYSFISGIFLCWFFMSLGRGKFALPKKSKPKEVKVEELIEALKDLMQEIAELQASIEKKGYTLNLNGNNFTVSKPVGKGNLPKILTKNDNQKKQNQQKQTEESD